MSSLNSKIPIIYEDNHLLIVHKPANVPVVADESKDADLLSILKADIKVRHNKPGNVYLGLVHRLDRPVSGLMVFARTSKAASRLSDQFRQKRVVKVYEALISGPAPESGAFTDRIRKNAMKRRAVDASDHPDGKEARLRYRLLNGNGSVSWIEIELESGRYHQIRYQCAHHLHPVIGDLKYWGIIPPGWPIDRFGIALASTRLRFDHPTREETMDFQIRPIWERYLRDR